MQFIFMLTRHDSTVTNAADVYESVRSSGLRYLGFKDVGVTFDELAHITDRAHTDGLEVVLEVVSTSKETELRSVENAREIGVDWVMGGTHAVDGARILQNSGIKYCPFPGEITGHPSVLTGTVDAIVADARKLSAVTSVSGLDLLAYRHPSVDVSELIQAVSRAVSVPVIVAGSIATAEQIRVVAAAGAWGFTIGGAVFDGRFPGAPDVLEQITEILRITEQVNNVRDSPSSRGYALEA